MLMAQSLQLGQLLLLMLWVSQVVEVGTISAVRRENGSHPTVTALKT
jgi:hypothetical protein